ncbi:ScbA/BarX family gamma-butyrolactone biosynthesis protein [Streptomyces sp. NPDC096068]|uniref:ScbA/BarX family gamma-butyrolactone biosynthesis protein n=1 Tax=Streptomyces sp. NPDC096068 TaxID=3155424 RepID=UPI003330453D
MTALTGQTQGGALPAVSVARQPSDGSGSEAGGTTGPPEILGRYTHLTDPGSILVSGWNRSGENSLALTVHWPPVTGERPYDPRVLAQTVRQSGLVVAHAEYGVPLDHQTVLSFLDFTIPDRLPPGGGKAARLDVDVLVSPAGDTGRARRSLRMCFLLRHEGVTIARADSEFGWIPPRVYRRLRGDRMPAVWGAWELPEPLDPARVGRADAGGVLLSPTGEPNRWRLRNDVSDTALFDHPVDHVPGLVLVEAADQAAHAVLGPRAFRAGEIATRYFRYVDFDRPCLIEARTLPAEPGRFALAVDGTQDAEVAFSTVLRGPAD